MQGFSAHGDANFISGIECFLVDSHQNASGYVIIRFAYATVELSGDNADVEAVNQSVIVDIANGNIVEIAIAAALFVAVAGRKSAVAANKSAVHRLFLSDLFIVFFFIFDYSEIFLLRI